MDYCKECGKLLCKDEIGLHKKLVNRGASSFWCKECLANHFKVSTSLLDEKIRQFKEEGCTLF